MFIKSLMKRIAIQHMVIIIKTRKRNTTKHNKTQQNATQHNAHRFLRVFPFLGPTWWSGNPLRDVMGSCRLRGIRPCLRRVGVN